MLLDMANMPRTMIWWWRLRGSSGMRVFLSWTIQPKEWNFKTGSRFFFYASMTPTIKVKLKILRYVTRLKWDGIYVNNFCKLDNQVYASLVEGIRIRIVSLFCQCNMLCCFLHNILQVFHHIDLLTDKPCRSVKNEMSRLWSIRVHIDSAPYDL